jgi:NAD-dependent deacetylase
MNLFILTGAGISAESGLGTFRDKGGMWTKYDPMTLATPKAFARDPALVHEVYNARRQNLLAAEPNAAHVALAGLEAGLAAQGHEITLVTQNVDDLHERAGSRQVIHMHGELFRIRCNSCNAERVWRQDLSTTDRCPDCDAVGKLRPAIVWFGEMPMHMEGINRSLIDSDLFVSIGTSGSVYPAAGFVSTARDHAIRTCELNLEPSDNVDKFDDGHYGPASKIVPDWVEKLLADIGR